MSEVSRHFDLKSINYKDKSNSGLWRLLRSIEKEPFINWLSKVDPQNKTLVDLGSGTGHYSQIAYDLGFKNITCVDLSDKMLNQIHIKNATKIQADLSDPHFVDNKLNGQCFDILLCMGTLEFIENPFLTLNEFIKLKKAGSSIFILFPQNSVWGHLYKLYHKFNGLNVHLFNPKSLEKWAQNYGLKVVYKKNIFSFSFLMVFE